MKFSFFINLLLFLLPCCFGNPQIVQETSCQVVIVGGTTAAFSAAISSAQEGAQTCLLEPTNWVGGQLTTSGVPAIDFAWHTVKDSKSGFVLNVGTIDRSQPNVTPSFWKMLHLLNETGECWVSNFCFPPQNLLAVGLNPLLESVSPKLKVFYNTVIKSVKTSDNKITSIVAIQRTLKPKTKCEGYARFLSQDLLDWYSPNNSTRFDKTLIEFSSPANRTTIFVDATEWGELLALSDAPYLQGINERFDGDTSGIGDDTCGQSCVFGFTERLHKQNTYEPPNPFPVAHPDYYSLDGYTWDKVWTYRRLYTKEIVIGPNDLTLQNWGTGNDYSFGYLFLSKNETKKSVLNNDWAGGVNISVISQAEQLAYGWHYWFKANAPTSFQNKITLQRKPFGTCHGLSKLPYIRDTRRSIGLDQFIMKVEDISGPAEQLTGKIFKDRMAIGAYNVDIHSIQGCKYPDYMHNYYPILPYFIPLRAMTNAKYENLVVAGKTMAQSFLVNAATRLHPVEYSSGTGAGVMVAFMANNRLDSTREALNQVASIQTRVQLYSPIQWTIFGKLIPSS